MPKLEIVVSHTLPPNEATKRVQTLLGEVKTQFSDKISDLREHWNGNTGTFSFKAMGFAVSGTLTVRQREVQLVGDLPFAALIFKKKIETTIRDEAERKLA